MLNQVRWAPASHTTIDPDYVAQRVAALYPSRGAVTAQLLYRGVNDVYVVRDEDGRRAFRIWRASTRAIGSVMQELAFLDFLRDAGIPVSNSIPASSGQRYLVFDTQEGQRPAALYDWAPGRKFGEVRDVATAERIGELFARMHLVARDYRPEAAQADDPAASMARNLPALLLWVEDRPEDRDDYTHLTHTLGERLSALGGLDLPRGMCHQDMHASNVHVAPDGAITFLDFDGAAPGYWLHDVKNFVFGNAFYGYPDDLAAAFERGYLRVRPYTADEVAAQELFLLAKAFRLLGAAAETSRSRGRDLLRWRNLDWFSGYIKPRARALGLL